MPDPCTVTLADGGRGPQSPPSTQGSKRARLWEELLAGRCFLLHLVPGPARDETCVAFAMCHGVLKDEEAQGIPWQRLPKQTSFLLSSHVCDHILESAEVQTRLMLLSSGLPQPWRVCIQENLMVLTCVSMLSRSVVSDSLRPHGL